jgi:hypothetical protein
MNRLLTVAIIAPLAALAPAAPVPKAADKPPVYYYPTAVGSKLVYNEPGKEVTYVVTKVEERDKGKTKLVTTARVEKDRNVPHKTIAVSAAGVAVVWAAGWELDEPVWSLRFMAGPQQAWIGDLGYEVRVGGTERVEVPAGAFEAVRVDGRADIMGMGFAGGRLRGRDLNPRLHCWYAPGIGLVKSVFDFGRAETQTLSVLTKFTPGK